MPEEDPQQTEAQTRDGSDTTASVERSRRRNQLASRYGPVLYRPVLICLAGPLRGARLSLTTNEIVIGRGSDADWRLNDGGASRRHVRINYVNHQEPGEMPECYVEDLLSRNGTELNGKLIHERTRLNERDRITIGASILGYFLRDDAELRHDESLYESATRDLLTGLDNRRQLVAHFRHYIARLQRHPGSHFSILLLDVDHFKSINDRFGHDVGDEALKHLAGILRATCRESDLIGRWGGEEFAVGLPETPAEAALALAERIRERIAGTDLLSGSRRIHFTASLGGTSYNAGDSLDTMFKRADEQLYRAKQSGRNRCQFSEQTQVG